MPYLLIAARAALIAVFALAVISKVRSSAAYTGFRKALRQLGIVPASTVNAAAASAVAVEAAIVVSLALPARPVIFAGFVLAAGLLVVYIAVIAQVIRRGNRTTCACFGVTATPLGPRHIVRNAVLIAVALTGAAATGTHGHPGTPPGYVTAMVAGLFVGLLAAASDDIMELIAPTR
jgi:hypothetical protein